MHFTLSKIESAPRKPRRIWRSAAAGCCSCSSMSTQGPARTSTEPLAVNTSASSAERPAVSKAASKLIASCGSRTLNCSGGCSPSSTTTKATDNRRATQRSLYSPELQHHVPSMRELADEAAAGADEEDAPPSDEETLALGSKSCTRCLKMASPPARIPAPALRVAMAPGALWARWAALRESRAKMSLINAERLWASTIPSPWGGTRRM
mmetsp:Transcript_101313/g.272174  ORF Transcript_101313/g.272174 Transcript_101313/m.272174 type:complete len:209 (+) Transcript_101313:706-1332(+)